MKGAYSIEELEAAPFVVVQRILAAESAEIQVQKVLSEQAALKK